MKRNQHRKAIGTMATPAGVTALLRRAAIARPLRDTAASAAAAAAASSSAVATPCSSHRRSLSVAASPSRPPLRRTPSALQSLCQLQPRRVSPLLPPPYGARSFSAAAGGGSAGSKDQETGPAIEIGSALRFKTIVDGKPMVPEDFEGKAVLVVNTASLCG